MSIYPVREDTLLVKRNLEILNLEGQEFLEIGAGKGEITVEAAEKGAEVTALDINPEAVEKCRERISDDGLEGEVVLSDLFERIDSNFDLIVFNPPYLKGPEIGDEEMWRGGETGLETAEKYLEQVPEYLSSGGQAWIVLSSTTNYERLFEKHGLSLIDERKLWFEKIFLYKLE